MRGFLSVMTRRDRRLWSRMSSHARSFADAARHTGAMQNNQAGQNGGQRLHEALLLRQKRCGCNCAVRERQAAIPFLNCSAPRCYDILMS